MAASEVEVAAPIDHERTDERVIFYPEESVKPLNMSRSGDDGGADGAAQGGG